MSKQVNNSCVSTLYNSNLPLINSSPSSKNTIDNNGGINDSKTVSTINSEISNDALCTNKQNNQNASGLSSAEALVKLLNRTMYPIVQENGQRRYGPPPQWSGESPKRGCEVFIGKIPRDCFEDELVPVFEKIGPIFMFRLMMDFTGTNRGYGFCIYMNRDDTKRAVYELNNYEIRPEKPLGVCLSVDNCRLFVGGIPKNKMKEEIFSEMSRVTEGVKDVIAYPSVADKTKNRGFAFVEYDSHKSAAMARRKLIPGRIQLWGQQIAVDWAEPEREVNEDIMQMVKILYVRNLMLSTTEDTLREKFVNASSGTIDCVERVKKLKDYAFVHFKDRFYADRAMKLLNNTQIDGSWIEVSWAKPVDKSEQKTKSSALSSTSTNGQPNNTMELNNNTELLQATGANQIFIDSTSGISYIGAPIQTIQTNQNLSNTTSSPNRMRTGRRNAAGSRSVANREKKPIPEVEENHQPLTWTTGCVPKPDWDNYGIKYQYIPTQMMFPTMNFLAPANVCPAGMPTPIHPTIKYDELKPTSDNNMPVSHLQEGIEVPYDGISNPQGSLGPQPLPPTLMSHPSMSHPSTHAMMPAPHYSTALPPPTETQPPSFYIINPAPQHNSGYTTTAPMPHPYYTTVATPHHPYATAFQAPQPTAHIYTTATLAPPQDYNTNKQLHIDHNNTTPYIHPTN